MKTLDRTDAEQLVLNQMDTDPTRRQGVRTTRHKISMTTGQHLTRDFVAEVMHTHDPEGFVLRDPSGKKILRAQKFPIGIHERWSGDGHEKLNEIGFPIWAAVDDATGKWLGAWVLPSNRKGDIIAILFLCLVEKYGGQFLLNSLHRFPYNSFSRCSTPVYHGLWFRDDSSLWVS